MSLPESYRVLRRGLFVRLAASVVLLVAAVGVALSLAPGAGDQSHRAPTVAATPAAVVSKATAPNRSPSIQSAAGVDGALADVMRGVSELEPLDGKSLEVLVQRSADESQAAGDSAGTATGEGKQRTSVQPAKLPKGPHLQAGIFASPANAEEMKKKLEAAGYPVYLDTRVHVGPFPNRKEADKVREKLKEQGTATLFIPQ